MNGSQSAASALFQDHIGSVEPDALLDSPRPKGAFRCCAKNGGPADENSTAERVPPAAKTAADSPADGRVKDEEPPFSVAVEVDNFRLGDHPEDGQTSQYKRVCRYLTRVNLNIRVAGDACFARHFRLADALSEANERRNRISGRINAPHIS